MKLFTLFFSFWLVFAHFEVTENSDDPSEHPRVDSSSQTDAYEFWSDQNLLQNRVIRLTDDLFDSQINDKPWLIFFVFDRHNPRYEHTLAYVYRLLLQVAQDAEIITEAVQVAFVDVLDEGELLKETFDIERQPACLYVKEKMVYYLTP